MATDTDFRTALARVLHYEGGYVNDPDDPGGATNKGVTQKTYDQWRDAQGLPRRSVRDITDVEVEDIYYGDYWLKSGADKLDMPLALIHFDTAVNMGVQRANQFLAASNGDTTAYLDARTAKYQQLAVANPTLSKFLGGWLHRVDSLRKLATPASAAVAVLATIGLLLWRAWK